MAHKPSALDHLAHYAYFQYFFALLTDAPGVISWDVSTRYIFWISPEKILRPMKLNNRLNLEHRMPSLHKK